MFREKEEQPARPDIRSLTSGSEAKKDGGTSLQCYDSQSAFAHPPFVVLEASGGRFSTRGGPIVRTHLFRSTTLVARDVTDSYAVCRSAWSVPDLGPVVLPVCLSLGWTHASLKQQHNTVKSRYHLATMRRWFCSKTIDIDFEASPEPAKPWRGRYRPGREDPLSRISIVLKIGESRKAAVSNSNLDSRSIVKLGG